MLRDNGEPELALHGTGTLRDRENLKLGHPGKHLIGSREVELRQAREEQKPGAKLAVASHGANLLPRAP